MLFLSLIETGLSLVEHDFMQGFAFKDEESFRIAREAVGTRKKIGVFISYEYSLRYDVGLPDAFKNSRFLFYLPEETKSYAAFLALLKESSAGYNKYEGETGLPLKYLSKNLLYLSKRLRSVF